MNYFLDTEFIEGFPQVTTDSPYRRSHFIDLISLALVAEDGRELYLVSNEYSYHEASNWVKQFVIRPLFLELCQTFPDGSEIRMTESDFHYELGYPNKFIAQKILEFIGEDESPLFYGYFGDYDWVLFCSLFGTMMELPSHFPMYCRDLKQSLDEKVEKLSNNDFFLHFHIEEPLSFKQKLQLVQEQNPLYPVQKIEHSALEDARWNQKLYHFLKTL